MQINKSQFQPARFSSFRNVLIAISFVILALAINKHPELITAAQNKPRGVSALGSCEQAALDISFGVQGKVATEIQSAARGSSIAVQPDGKIVAAGYSRIAIAGVATSDDFTLVRYTETGGLDQDFGGGTGKVITALSDREDRANSVAIQPDGKIVAAGYAYVGTGQGFALARYNIDGTLDTTFDGDGKVTTLVENGEIKAIAIQPDGRIVVAGFGGGGFAVARFDLNGSLDPTFDNDGIAITSVSPGWERANSVIIQPDGKIVVGGFAVNGVNADQDSDFALVRYEENGSLDSAFGSGGIVVTSNPDSVNSINALGLQDDGKIVAAGYNEYVVAQHPVSRVFSLVRYNQDGTLDLTFDGDGRLETVFGIYDDRANAVAIQPDGKIIAVGFSVVENGSDYAVARYKADGSLDDSFGVDGKRTVPDLTSSEYGYAAAIQPDGKILVGGYSLNTNVYLTRSNFAVIRLVGTSCVQSISANVSGRVLTPGGLGLRNATVVLTDSNGNRRSATTSSFGVYAFANVPTGSVYTITVASKRYRFGPRSLEINGNLTGLDFTGLE